MSLDLLSLSLVLLSSAPAYLYYRRSKRLEKEVSELKRLHQETFEAFIRDLNHVGAVPLSSSAVGMHGAVTLGLSQSYLQLQELAQKYPEMWPALLQFKEVLTSEYPFSLTVVEKSLKGIRATLQKYNDQQYPIQ